MLCCVLVSHAVGLLLRLDLWKFKLHHYPNAGSVDHLSFVVLCLPHKQEQLVWATRMLCVPFLFFEGGEDLVCGGYPVVDGVAFVGEEDDS